MHPAFSVILLTTLIGAGQGLFLALYAADVLAALQGFPRDGLRAVMVGGSWVAFVLCGLGLFASFFHLGHPERAWRAAAGWRTSWLSREVIALPAFMSALAAFALARQADSELSAWIGFLASLLGLVLFACTGMVYASIRAIREWASGLTVLNFLLLGLASGTTLAAATLSREGAFGSGAMALAAMVLIVLSLCSRVASIIRNSRIPAKTNLQTAIGIKHPRIVQRSQGAMGGSFNTREFFHGQPAAVLRASLGLFLLSGCILPLMLLAFGPESTATYASAFAVQYVGLLAERWLFFAEGRHPQNLYYQSIA